MNFYNITYFLIKNNSSNNYRSQNIFQNSLREMEWNRKSAYTCSTRCFPRCLLPSIPCLVSIFMSSTISPDSSRTGPGELRELGLGCSRTRARHGFAVFTGLYRIPPTAEFSFG